MKQMHDDMLKKENFKKNG